MNVSINDKQTETSATTVAQLAAELDLPSKGIAIAIDNKMVPRAQWDETHLTVGAKIIILKAFCGG